MKTLLVLKCNDEYFVKKSVSVNCNFQKGKIFSAVTVLLTLVFSKGHKSLITTDNVGTSHFIGLTIKTVSLFEHIEHV